MRGGDSYWARDLFERGKSTREVFPMFMLTFICNKLPKLKYSDKATWNRIRVIPFESTFVEPGEPCPVTFEEQIKQKRFPMDKEFGKNIPGLVSAFAWYLLQWRQKVNVRVEPEKVREATAIYRRQNDVYRQFIEECIIDDDSASLTLTEIYAQFKEWFKEGWPNMSLPIKNEVKEYFDRLWGESERGIKWDGHRIRTLQDDVDSGEVIILEEDDLVKYDKNTKTLPPM
jgi:phage/plasmid-associated DNA primase